MTRKDNSAHGGTHDVAAKALSPQLIDQIRQAHQHLSTVLCDLDPVNTAAPARPALSSLGHVPQLNDTTSGGAGGAGGVDAKRISELERETERLQTALHDLQQRYDTERHGWIAFKEWWLGAVEKRERKRKRKASRDTRTDPDRDAASGGGGGSGGDATRRGAATATATAMRLSDHERELCRRVGVDIDAIVTSSSTTATTTTTTATAAAEAHGADKENASRRRGAPDSPERQPSSSIVLPLMARRPSPSKSPPGEAGPVGRKEAGNPTPGAEAARESTTATPAPARRLPLLDRQPQSDRPRSRVAELAASSTRRGAQVSAATDAAVAAAVTTPSKASCAATRADRLRAEDGGNVTRSEPRLGVIRALADSPPSSPPKAPASTSARAPSASGVAAPETPSQFRARVRASRAAELEALTADPLRNKGKGRYAREVPQVDGQGSTAGASTTTATKTINQEYRIDAERNAGVGHAFVGSERKRSTRKQMHGLDCDCCRDYWENIGPLPPKAGPVRARAAQRGTKEGGGGEGGGEAEGDGEGEEEEAEEKDADADAAAARREAEIQARRQATSRHRAWGLPDTTPPGYWNINFPDTQQQDEINAQARLETERKRRRIAADPRFVKRR
ncbi:uncharacterized protein PFL1_01851 [Pseudozyma flocculosa PF-1]|uniref:DNA endonuclease activator Ctp1 C-terminal domain-containing protein n=1 Tax=Pseudozyma flocculosa TaxID=84751 RepID=A0A5C3EZZ2_9BASI|nr:uncharacterized protein PFL1_01851 [Pseudozyma flocculosa PF-1]EPQ30325.1 hypothetical protein PFL1_01851 [Pseudozyma flocculosa PF-1]SPO37395.1 uncharacterized protein PSFLO_02868 [Pseudozyma flocculosa]